VGDACRQRFSRTATPWRYSAAAWTRRRFALDEEMVGGQPAPTSESRRRRIGGSQLPGRRTASAHRPTIATSAVGYGASVACEANYHTYRILYMAFSGNVPAGPSGRTVHSRR